MVYLVDKIEKDYGLLKGHVVVEFETTPTYFKQIYECDGTPSHKNLLLERSAGGGSAAGDGCHVTGCTGHLKENFKNKYKCPGCAKVSELDEKAANVTHTCNTNCPGAMTKSGGLIKGPKQKYKCPVCKMEKTYGGPNFPNTKPCEKVCRSRWDLESSDKQAVTPGKATSLPLSSQASPLGGVWVSSFQNSVGLIWACAHELAHDRHIEHAGNAPGAKDAQHDIVVNPNPEISNLAEPANTKRWDRCCTMTYVKDKERFFCGKCLLKNRGWKVEGITDP